MLEDTLDDDTHLCIKCNVTIIGLEEYIRHRKANCAGSSRESQSVGVSGVNKTREGNDPEYSMHDHAYDKDHHSPMHTFEYDLGADFFFSSLELQSSTKKSTGGKTVSGGKTIPRDNSPTDKLFNAVTAISGQKPVEPKDFHYFDDDVSPDEEENNDEDETDIEEFEDIPPRNHTGGKWKPENRPSSTLFRGWERAWDDDRLEKSFDESIYDDEAPPPGHTKGKWVPGSKITKLVYDKPETIPLSTQIWCNSCNKGLASKIVYERHLKSNLHLKRIQEERDLETIVCPIIEKPENIHHRRTLKPSIYTDNSLYEENTDTQKRIRRKYFTNCDICKTRLPIKLLGKHLISHYHYRRMQLHPQNAYDIILKNIDKIVVQSPFQCMSCKFYTTTQDNFFHHWNSETHKSKINSYEGRFLCNFCKFETLHENEITSHLMCQEHQDVVKAINRSVPIVIQKIRQITCTGCNETFRYNIELNKHVKECGEGKDTGTQFRCELCKKNFRTHFALVKHQTSEHQDGMEVKKFFCSICKENFTTPEDARKHRRTTEHRVKSARLRGLDKDGALMKKCGVCGIEGFSDVLVLKDHIKEKHPDVKYSCPHCATNFVLPQELSRHVRDKSCKFFTNLPETTTTEHTKDSNQIATSNVDEGGLVVASSTPTDTCDGDGGMSSEQQSYFTMTASISGTSNDNGIYVDEIDGSIADDAATDATSVLLWKCKLCTFGTKSRAEFIHHKILHNVPHVKPSDKLECPFCKRSYVKASLRCHLRIHTNERFFVCNRCSWSFIRAANLKEHIKNVHERQLKEENLFKCDVCSKGFRSKNLLSEHMLVHRTTVESSRTEKTFKCTLCTFITTSRSEQKLHFMNHHKTNASSTFECNYDGCTYHGKSLILLKRHMEIHFPPKRIFNCAKCDFETRHSGHLKRHLKVHDTNEDRYLQCPHCDYRCNIMDNLRKHVIRTSKHLGRFLYECGECNTGTNSTQEFKEHLSGYHGQLDVDLTDYFINKIQC